MTALGTVLWSVSPENKQPDWSMHHKTASERTTTNWETYSPNLNTWVDVTAYPIPNGGIAVYLRDISEAKQREQTIKVSTERQLFLWNLVDSLYSLADFTDIHSTVTSAVMDYFGADRCYYHEFEANTAIVRRDAFSDALTSVAGIYPLCSLPSHKDFIHTDCQAIIVPDLHTIRPVYEGLKQFCTEFKIVSYINVPVVKAGKLAGILCLAQCKPRIWTEEEVNLASTIAERTWAAIDKIKTEKALRESEYKYRTIFETAGEGIIYTDPKGIYLQVNSRFAAMLGYSCNEIPGKSLADFSFAGEQLQIRQIRKTLNNGSMIHGEYRFRRKDGSELWTMFNATPIFNTAGEHIANFAMHTDITKHKNIETALHESEEKYRRLFEAMSEGCAIIEMVFNNCGRPVNYSVLEVNPAWESQNGISKEHVLGKWVTEFLPAIEPTLFEHYGEVVICNKSKRFESYSPLTHRWFEIFAYPLRKNNQLAIIFTDITKRKQTEEALLASEQQQREIAGKLRLEQARLSAILDNLPVGVWFADQSGKIISKNKAVDHIWGGNVILVDSPEDYPEVYAAWNAVSGKQLSTADYPFVKVLQTGQPFKPAEFIIRRLDGSQGTVLISATPVFDQQGQNHGVVKISLDITERKRLETELRQHRDTLSHLLKERSEQLKYSKRSYMSLMNSLPMSIALYDKNLRYVYCNQYRNKHKSGVETTVDLAGKTWAEAGIPETIYQPWQKKYNEALNTGCIIELEDQFLNEAGEKRIFLVRIFPEKNEVGQVESLLSIGMDITDHKKTTTELQRLDRLNTVGEMAAALGHEIRNPLTTVRGYLQMFQRKEKFTEYEAQFNTMIEEIDRANLIITSFLSLTKSKAAETKPGNLNNTINALYPLIQAEALHLGHDVIIDISDIPNIDYDDGEVRQLILNLVRNGLEAMTKKGVLKLKTSQKSDAVILSIQDSGAGIPKNILNKIGTPFLTTKDNGTGLGLAVSYRIAERHNATINLKTSSQGTTFIVSFPIKP